jgi:hypothetical protein
VLLLYVVGAVVVGLAAGLLSARSAEADSYGAFVDALTLGLAWPVVMLWFAVFVLGCVLRLLFRKR